jgi:glyoxylase-like metal-dependent hydrolase (beta-lactamase superfamily II)
MYRLHRVSKRSRTSRRVTHELKLLSLIDVEVESSFLVLARNMGTKVWVHTWGILILGNPAGPILVDTGASPPGIMERLGMNGRVTEKMRLESQLAAHGLAVGAVAAVLHTHTAGALRLLDLELSGPDEIYPGIVCEAAGGHTEGSMNILVETAEGTACICGDVIYDVQNQVADPWHQVLAHEPQTTGNHTMTKRQEKAAIKKALNAGAFVLPLHDFPARVEGGKVVARLKDSVPGLEWSVEEFAGEYAEPVAAV